MTLPLDHAATAAHAQYATPLRRIRSTTRRTPLDLGELWRYRDLWLTLALRDVKLRYRQTALGVAWVVLLPLLASGIFTLVFGVVAGLPSDGSPYFLFVFAGYLGWSAFQNTLQRCGTSLIGNTALVTKVYFPRIILPAASVLASLLDFAIGVVLLELVLLVRGDPPSLASLAMVPLFMLLLQLVALGAGLISAALSVKTNGAGMSVTAFIVKLLSLFRRAKPIMGAGIAQINRRTSVSARLRCRLSGSRRPDGLPPSHRRAFPAAGSGYPP
jgi:lipopolysaccharide transport system permease protein